LLGGRVVLCQIIQGIEKFLGAGAGDRAKMSHVEREEKQTQEEIKIDMNPFMST